MKPVLLDVNVLVAVLDPVHVSHITAMNLFGEFESRGWLSCPTTQNGVARIVSHPRYGNTQPLPVVLDSLASLVELPSHRFVPDDLSLLDRGIDRARLSASGMVTDSYLLALAVRHDAVLATFDRRLVTTAVDDGAQAIWRLP